MTVSWLGDLVLEGERGFGGREAQGAVWGRGKANTM